MPQLFKIGSYTIYFWSNENEPLEPIHVHIAEGRATANATKIWITSSGKALLCNNKSHIPQKILKKMLRFIEANSSVIIEKWVEQFNEIRYFCEIWKIWQSSDVGRDEVLVMAKQYSVSKLILVRLQ